MAPKYFHAARYADWRWSLVRLTGKKCSHPWTRYQTQRADDGQLRKWFDGDSRANIGVVLGEISGGLGVMDFDKMPAFDAWAESHPRLARTLPTVRTKRGAHVYFRREPCAVDAVRAILGKPEHRGAFALDGGELRITSGCYCAVPPSVHPEGPIYSWVKEPTHGDFPMIDPIEAGFVPCDTADIEDSRHLKGTTSAVPTVSHGCDQAGNAAIQPIPNPKTPRSDWSADQSEKIHFAIASCLPTNKGQRHRMLFKLARELKAIPALADATPEALKPYLKLWHAGAVDTIATKPFEESWLDFAEGWENVKFPAGQGPIDLAFAKASASTPPACAAAYEQETVRLLVCLCRELQAVSGNAPFFLSSRTAAALFGVDHATAARWLKLLRLDRVIHLVSQGTKKTGQASTYVYRGGE
jgi:Bifunctional DNA primase/polymerase, N-terminal